jgi:hypothetical protein
MIIVTWARSGTISRLYNDDSAHSRKPNKICNAFETFSSNCYLCLEDIWELRSNHICRPKCDSLVRWRRAYDCCADYNSKLTTRLSWFFPPHNFFLSVVREVCIPQSTRTDSVYHCPCDNLKSNWIRYYLS